MNQEILLAVDGMTCASCVRHVEGALRELDGIAKIQVELGQGRVRIEHDPARASVPQMIEALEDAGYASRRAGA